MIELFGLLALGMLVIPLCLAAFVFWVWMLVHSIMNDRIDGTQRVLWALLIWFLPVIGSVVYFFLGRQPATPRVA